MAHFYAYFGISVGDILKSRIIRLGHICIVTLVDIANLYLIQLHSPSSMNDSASPYLNNRVHCQSFGNISIQYEKWHFNKVLIFSFLIVSV